MNLQPFARELGPQEALFCEMTRQSHGGLQLISFIKVCEPLRVEPLCKGLAYLHQRHPLLRARVQRGKKLRWVCDVDFRDIPLQILRVDKPLNLESEFINHGMNCLDSEKYVYSLTFYLDQDGLVEWVSVLNVHSVMDGRSIMTLFSDLDKYLRNDKEQGRVQSLPLLESIASRLEAAGYSGEKEVEHKNKGDFQWMVEENAPSSKRTACAISYLMPLETVRLLAQLSKKNQVKLTAVFCAVAAIAARVVPVYKNLTEIILALDARGLCSPNIPLDHIGSFSETTSLKLPPNVESVNVIDIAKILQEQIDSVLLKQSPMTKNLSSDYKMEDITRMAAEITAPQNSFSAGIVVSNVGDMTRMAEKIKYFEIREGMVTQTNGINPVMVINYTTFRNSVFVFGYCEPLISRRSISMYAHKYMDIIKEMIEDV